MITSINLEKSFDKNMQYSFTIKIPEKLVIEENFLNPMKNFYQNLTTNAIVRVKHLKYCHKMWLSLFLFNILLQAISGAEIKNKNNY